MKPRAWWKVHGVQFPTLHDVVPAIFSIPMSASPKECESAASKFASIDAANRSTLSPDQVHWRSSRSTGLVSCRARSNVCTVAVVRTESRQPSQRGWCSSGVHAA